MDERRNPAVHCGNHRPEPEVWIRISSEALKAIDRRIIRGIN
jgi:hypothetical protein